MEVRSKVYTYKTSLKWTERKMGMLSSPGRSAGRHAAGVQGT